MKSILFLISGGGGSLRFIYNLWKKNYFPELSEINIIFDRDCEAIEWCQRKRLNYKVVDVSKKNQKDLLQQSLIINPYI